MENIKVIEHLDSNKEKEKNRLIFNSAEDYEAAITLLSEKDENFIDTWSKNNSFISMKNAYTKHPEEMPVKDDVLLKVFKLENSNNTGKSSYCSGNTKTTHMNSPGGRIDCKIRYLKLGIYYQLYAIISKANSSAVKIGLTTIYYNKTKYQNRGGCWSYSGNKSGYGNSYKLTAYSGIKRLKAYIIPINFWYDCINGTSYDNVGLNMSCGTPNC